MTSSGARSQIFQRHWTWWLLFAVLALVAAVRLRLLDIPLERDEGEYAYAGQLMLQGLPPYELAYNMKFPGMYLAYAVIMAVFGQTPAGIHLGLLIMTTGTAFMLFWLGKKILDETAGVVAATSYALLAASPSMLGLAGHATHFCAFFVTAGLCGLWRARQRESGRAAFVSGFLFGLAVLMKQHAVIIAAWAGMAFAVTGLRLAGSSWNRRLWLVGACALGMLLPFVLCGWFLWQAGVFGKFWFWTVDYARQYAGIQSSSEAGLRFRLVFPQVVATTVLLWLLAAAGLVLMWFDGRLRGTRLWLVSFSAASALTVLPGFYFRPHYFLVTLPAVALCAGCAVSGILRLQLAGEKASSRNPLMAVFAVFLAATFFINRDLWFVKAPVSASREIYGLPLFVDAENVADFIRTNSVAAARVAVIGSEPEIYFHARRHSATGYIYTYPLMEPQPFARQMQEEMIREIEAVAPEFVVYVEGDTSWGRCAGSDPKIFDWWNAYRTNYTRVLSAGEPAPARKTSGCTLFVYQRNRSAAGGEAISPH